MGENKTRILITGGQGFLGTHLFKTLSSFGFQVYAEPFDVTSEAEIQKALDLFPSPGIVIHLAGISNVPECETKPLQAFDVNVNGTHVLLKTLCQRDKNFLFILASSGQLYESSDLELTEASPINPKNFYAKTKYMAEMLVEKYALQSEFRGISLRLFNQVHKSQAPNFFLTGILKQLQEAKNANSSLVLKVGRVDVYRDISAVQDFVSAIVRICEKNSEIKSTYETYNLCSGKEKLLKGLIAELAKSLGVEYQLETRPELLRNNDPKVYVGSSAKFSKAFDWQPKRSLSVESLIEAFLE